MYCTFEACSSLVVEKRAVPTFTHVPLYPGPSVTRKALNLAEENTKQLPNLNLIELIQSEDEGNFVQTISRVRCRVTIVQKASLRWLCKRCGELVTRNECIGGCYGAVGYKFHAEARYVYYRCSNICRARLFWAFINPRLLFDRHFHYLESLLPSLQASVFIADNLFGINWCERKGVCLPEWRHQKKFARKVWEKSVRESD